MTLGTYIIAGLVILVIVAIVKTATIVPQKNGIHY